jgi:hypothetical protein
MFKDNFVCLLVITLLALPLFVKAQVQYFATIQNEVDNQMGKYCRDNLGIFSYWSGKPKETCLCQDGYAQLVVKGKLKCTTVQQSQIETREIDEPCRRQWGPYAKYNSETFACMCSAGSHFVTSYNTCVADGQEMTSSDSSTLQACTPGLSCGPNQAAPTTKSVLDSVVQIPATCTSGYAAFGSKCINVSEEEKNCKSHDTNSSFVGMSEQTGVSTCLCENGYSLNKNNKCTKPVLPTQTAKKVKTEATSSIAIKPALPDLIVSTSTMPVTTSPKEVKKSNVFQRFAVWFKGLF